MLAMNGNVARSSGSRIAAIRSANTGAPTRICWNEPICRDLEDGDRVAAFGVYSGTYRATDKSMRAAFAHLYEVKGGKIARMQQYVDTHLVQQALTFNETI
jgi:hypothetical protein